MPVPAHKKSNASGRRRRSHRALKSIATGICKSCKAPVMPHRACSSCGSYKDRQSTTQSR